MVRNEANTSMKQLRQPSFCLPSRLSSLYHIKQELQKIVEISTGEKDEHVNMSGPLQRQYLATLRYIMEHISI